MTIGILIIVLLLLAAAWWWFIGRSTPKFAPLNISDDDPLMIEALEKAKSTSGNFLDLLSEEYFEAQIKVPFLSSSGETEHLWAEVLKLEGSVLNVRYYTPPVTHTGKLDRLHNHDVSEIEDWVVILNSGKIHGGFTQRVMFQRAREQWGGLPKELAEQESQYVA